MQLAIDSLDRLVELAEERGGRVLASEAASHVLALKRVPEGVARSLLGPLVVEDARLEWRGAFVALADHRPPLLEEAQFVVFDLETTGLLVASARICEIGAVRIEQLESTATFETLVAPGVPLPAPIGALTGLSEQALRRTPRVATALRRFRSFAGESILVAHNARFDVGFVNRELQRLTGKRLCATVIDTVPLARNLLRGRAPRTSLAALSHFFGTSVSPCHRALPDAQATAEVLIALIELARERGAETVADLEELAAPRPRRVHAKRHLVRDAPARPGVYLFRDEHERVLYVGKARDLRARLRSYFQTERQRRPVETALDALERVEWHVFGSELAAALEEIRLIRTFRPVANARTPQPERYTYLRRQGSRVLVSKLSSPYGPIRKHAHADRAARALRGCSEEEFARLLLDGPPQRLHEHVRELADSLRWEDARRLRHQIASLDRVVGHLRSLERLRRLELCLTAPALEQGWRDAFFVAGGRIVTRRSLPPGGGARLELDAGIAVARAAAAGGCSYDADHLDELLVVASFLQKRPPELGVIELDAEHRDAAA